MNARHRETDRRAIGQHIGAALRHARAACGLNLEQAPLDAIQREAGHALDCLTLIVWDRKNGHEGGE
jgi:hypothetical protein